MGKGSTRLLVIVGIIALFVLAWYTMYDEAASKQKEYDSYVSIAREKHANELYADAIDNYNAALRMNDSLKLREEIADFYKSIGRIDSYLGFCDQTITAYPLDEKFYIRLVEHHRSTSNYTMCFKILNNASKRGISSKRLNEIRAELQYVFEVRGYGYEEVRPFSGDLCAVKRGGGNWGYATLAGTTYLGFNYLSAKEFVGGYAAVQLATEEYALIDSTGREKSKDPEKKKIEDCLVLYEGKISVKYNGKYHYCNEQFQELFGSYDYAGTFNGGVAAVMDKDKWFIIDAEGNKVGDKTFDEIVVDEKGVAFRNGVAFAKSGDKYYLIDTTGNKVGQDTWADVDCFNSTQPAAVSNGKRWGYVNASGEMVVDYTYGNAKSFSNGFAAVAVQDKWGYIILEDYSLKIEHQFNDAQDFSRNGTAFVKQTGGWDILKLYSYN